MAQAKRTYILMIKVTKLFSVFHANFLKRIKNLLSVFLSFQVDENSKELWQQHFSFSQTSTSTFYSSIETGYWFSISLLKI